MAPEMVKMCKCLRVWKVMCKSVGVSMEVSDDG